MNATQDINVLMRQGHVYIADIEELCIKLVHAHCQRVRPTPTVLEIGCASGLTSMRLARELREARIIAHEDYAPFAALAELRLRDTRVELHSQGLAELRGPVDVILSAGAHHHLPPSYLTRARELLAPEGVFILADEFCPEYCTVDERAHVNNAPLIYLANGYVLTSAAERDAYLRDGTLPQRARDMEVRRRRALWHWYRFVVDEAITGGHIEVAVAELQSAHDDLITGEEAEHKLAPCIVERQLALAGFEIANKHVLGPPLDPSLHSLIAYELVPAR
jgi:SAM-dependent methyltransferase